MLLLVLLAFLLQQGGGHPPTPGPYDPFNYTFFPAEHFSVSAVRKGPNTNVLLVYPDHENIWTCVVMRRPAEPAYEPRWCFRPNMKVTEMLVLYNWPPVPSTDKWEVKGFVQWYIGRNDEFGYKETEWEVVR